VGVVAGQNPAKTEVRFRQRGAPGAESCRAGHPEAELAPAFGRRDELGSPPEFQHLSASSISAQPLRQNPLEHPSWGRRLFRASFQTPSSGRASKSSSPRSGVPTALPSEGTEIRGVPIPRAIINGPK
jgi:hypothetical protein